MYQSPYLVKQYARKKIFSLIIGDKNWIFRNRQNTSQLGHHDVDISDSFVKTSSPLNVPGVPGLIRPSHGEIQYCRELGTCPSLLPIRV